MTIFFRLPIIDYWLMAEDIDWWQRILIDDRGYFIMIRLELTSVTLSLVLPEKKGRKQLVEWNVYYDPEEWCPEADSLKAPIRCVTTYLHHFIILFPMPHRRMLSLSLIFCCFQSTSDCCSLICNDLLNFQRNFLTISQFKIGKSKMTENKGEKFKFTKNCACTLLSWVEKQGN